MTHLPQLRTDEQDNLPGPLLLQEPAAPQGAGAFARLHKVLRGRYHWAILLTLVGLIAGAYGGFKTGHSIYTSSGMIHVKPVLPKIIYSTERSAPMPMFESFVRAQVSLIQSQRVVDMALSSPEWKALNRANTDELFDQFMQHLNVSTSGGEMIVVSYADPDPDAATAAVKSIITAYNRIYVEGQIESEEKQRQTIADIQATLNTQLRLKREAIESAAQQFATDDLRTMLSLKIQDLNGLERMLADLELAAPSVPAPHGPQTQPAARELSVFEIAMRDQGMRELSRAVQQIQNELDLSRKNLGENNSRTRDLKNQLEVRQREAEQYAAEYRAAMKQNGNLPITAEGGAEDLVTRRERCRKMIDNLKAEVAAINKKMFEIEKLRGEEHDIDQRLEETRKRADELSTESRGQGRIELVSFGQRPMLLKDTRKQNAAMGGIGGGGLGFGLIFLFCLLDRRFRNPDEIKTQSASLPMLGVVPRLPSDLSDPDQAAMAAYCVHQIRTLLQLGQGGEGSRVFAITSPASGTGKTSITLALGVSFAAANTRTLMIDCDMVGAGLTVSVNAIIRRRLGQIFVRDGLITAEQLEHALRIAQQRNRRLGEILVELEYVSEIDVKRALSTQCDSPVGVLDALAGQGMAECIAPTGVEGLWILPLGTAQPGDAHRIAPDALRKLIAAARENFDTVLVDTGPIPASIEASLAAAASDVVVLVVSRGEHRALAMRAIDHLRDIGARIAGVVFNRADHTNLTLSTSMSRSTPASKSERSHGDEAIRPSAYGPIASAVATLNTTSEKSSS